MLLFDEEKKMSRYLLLAWDSMTKAGYPLTLDLIPEEALLLHNSTASHLSVYTDGDGKLAEPVEAVYHARCAGDRAVFDYRPGENRREAVYCGIMALEFDSISKESLLRVYWNPYGSENTMNPDHHLDSTGNVARVNAAWVYLPHDQPCGKAGVSFIKEIYERLVRIVRQHSPL